MKHELETKPTVRPDLSGLGFFQHPKHKISSSIPHVPVVMSYSTMKKKMNKIKKLPIPAEEHLKRSLKVVVLPNISKSSDQSRF